jgi:membrane-bound lytic murein transglycosylase D
LCQNIQAVFVNRKSITYFLIIAFTFLYSVSLSQPDNLFIKWYAEQIEATKSSTIFNGDINLSVNDSVLLNFDNHYLSNKFLPSKHTKSYYNMIVDYDTESVLTIIAAWYSYKNKYESLCNKLSIPRELAALPLALSAINTKSVNHKGNTGMWQLDYLPAVKYGLHIEYFYDERLDPIMSGEAGLRYLKSLFEITGNWSHAIIAYNTGMPLFRKALNKCNCTHPDSLQLYLPENYRHTYPMFLAGLQIANKLESFADQMPVFKQNNAADLVHIYDLVHLEQISSVLKIDISEINYYNPLFTDLIIDGRKKPIPLLLPTEKTSEYELLKDSIYNYLDSIYFPPPPEMIITYSESGNVLYNPGEGYERIDYVIGPGDNLGAIAENFEVELKDIRDWNGINGNTIYAGKKLYIYKPVGEANKYRNISQKETKKQEKAPIPEGSKEITYEVKSGDSPYTIAKKFDGVSDYQIMSWNNVSDPSKLQLGQKLKIYIVE